MISFESDDCYAFLTDRLYPVISLLRRGAGAYPDFLDYAPEDGLPMESALCLADGGFYLPGTYGGNL